MSTEFDFERCLHALSGQATQHQDPSTRAGRLMRRLLLERQAHAGVVTVVAHPTEAANQRLMARLRAADAFSGKPIDRGGPRWLPRLLQQGLPTWLSLPAAAGLLSLAGMAIFMLVRPVPTSGLDPQATDDGLEVMRGNEQAQHLRVANPQAFADEVQALLKARQVPVWRKDGLPPAGQSPQQIQLHAKLPADDAQLKQALQARGISLPEHGRLFLVIEGMPESRPTAAKPPKPN
ncbi:hypothetical protein WG899_03995 [Paucibacter sp. AS339]|uniref:hypothetical protein n=1 Tax=Paucibacter hankyongi TaxID=3133434 RepID=UPI0030AAD6CA